MRATALAILSLSPLAAAQVEYTVRELPSIGAIIPISRPYNINDAGQVAGESWRDGQDFHAVIWEPDGSLVDLGEVGVESLARAISPAGVVTGQFGRDAAIWVDGERTVLPGLAGAFGASAWGVNDAAVAVGVSVSPGGIETAVAWRNGAPSPIVDAPSWASAIDEEGRIAGRRDVGSVREAIIVDDSGVTTLPDGGSGIASAIALAGGYAAGDIGQPPVIWKLDDPIELIRLEVTSAFGTAVADVNDAGVAVGRMCVDLTCDIDRRRAVIWRDGALTDLNDLIDPASGWTLAEATGINNASQIVGFGRLVGAPGGGVRAFVLTPVDACVADFDGDGELTFFDFLAFQNAFAAGDPRADLTGDGALDFFDFLEFQNLFAAGCN